MNSNYFPFYSALLQKVVLTLSPPMVSLSRPQFASPHTPLNMLFGSGLLVPKSSGCIFQSRILDLSVPPDQLTFPLNSKALLSKTAHSHGSHHSVIVLSLWTSIPLTFQCWCFPESHSPWSFHTTQSPEQTHLCFTLQPLPACSCFLENFLQDLSLELSNPCKSANYWKMAPGCPTCISNLACLILLPCSTGKFSF